MLPAETASEIARQHEFIFQENYRLNICVPGSAEFLRILKKIVNEISDDTVIKPPVYFDIGNVYFGEHCFVNRDVKFIDFGGIDIGSNVGISTNVVIIATDHPKNPLLLDEWVDEPIPVVIKDGAWIGAGAIIKGPVTIGTNAIVGAGAVVTKDVPDNAVVVGNPASILRYNEER